MPTVVPEKLRPYRKLIRAVAELHVRGYQRIRVVPSFYDLGTWRCAILPAIYISRAHGARWVEGVPPELVAPYSSASDNEYWGWRDQKGCSPSHLAEVFLEHFPRIAELGYGQDWPYVGWYAHMLHLTYPDALPISRSEPQGTPDFATCLGMLGERGVLGFERTIPLPPPGHAAADHVA